MPSLIDLIRAYGKPAEYDAALAQVNITSITADSRHVTPGAAFVALPGTKADGAKFIPEAIQKGAAVVVAHNSRIEDREINHESPITIHVENPRLALSKFAAAIHAPQPEHIVAVTGTDGKTSTAEFTRQLWVMLGKKAASIGTLGVLGENGQQLAPGMHTTPDPVTLHQLLQQLARDGYTHVAMEASSHGLHQYRLDGVKLKSAAFTTLTRDHLDYHLTDEAYFAAKQRLFTELLLPGEPAVLNADSRSFAELLRLSKARGHRVMTYGKAGEDLRIEKLTPHAGGQVADLRIFGTAHQLDLPHVGAFQVYNMLAALGLVGSDAVSLLPRLKGVPGRMQQAAPGVYVDYAHTPAALENALKTLRPHTQGRLIVVFGCGGERDAGKRPLMGKAAAELADIAIVTDDNPRSEDAAAIRAEVLAGAKGAKEIADRHAAIYAAVKLLASGDVLLVAGKGHETTQIIGTVAHPFDDAAVVREALQKL